MDVLNFHVRKSYKLQAIIKSGFVLACLDAEIRQMPPICSATENQKWTVGCGDWKLGGGDDGGLLQTPRRDPIASPLHDKANKRDGGKSNH